MANPTDPRAEGFRAELDDGQVVEVDGSTVTDPQSDAPVPVVVLRMNRTRAHLLAHLLDDWCRAARVFATFRSSEVTERALAWALEASAAAGGDPGATRCALAGPQTPSVAQRLAAAAVLSERERRINCGHLGTSNTPPSGASHQPQPSSTTPTLVNCSKPCRPKNCAPLASRRGRGGLGCSVPPGPLTAPLPGKPAIRPCFVR
jgi:hypothetical protein